MHAAHRILYRLRPELFAPTIKRARAKRLKTKAKIPPTVRAAVLERDGHQCVTCGSGDDLTLHHVIPRKDGGKNAADNLVTLCVDCHIRQHQSG